MISFEQIAKAYYQDTLPAFENNLRFRFSSILKEEVKDLYQDTFMVISKNLIEGKIENMDNMKSYIIKVGMNLAHKHFRGRKKMDLFHEKRDMSNSKNLSVEISMEECQDLAYSLAEETPTIYQNKMAWEILNEEIGNLPEKQASLLRFYFFDRLSMKEISDELGYKNATTAKAKKCQSLNALRFPVKQALLKYGLIA